MKYWYGIRIAKAANKSPMAVYSTREEAEARAIVCKLDYPAAYAEAVVVELFEVEAADAVPLP